MLNCCNIADGWAAREIAVHSFLSNKFSHASYLER